LFAGCHQGSMSEKLNEIDSLVAKEQYDSAAMLLGDVAKVSLTDEDQAHYNLLATQLGYLTKKPLPSDSLLDQAIAYYKKVGNQQKLADAYYYKAFRLGKENDFPQAIMYSKEAEQLAVNIKDDHLHFKIAESLADLNSFSGNDLLSLQYGKKALALAQKVQNGNWIAYSYSYIYFAFYNLGQEDSAYFYVEKSIPYVKYVNDIAKSFFLMNIGVIYKENNKEKAKEYFEKSITYGEMPENLEHLADIYYSEGKKEEAYMLWRKALSKTSRYEKDNLIRSILTFDLERGKLDEARQFVDEIIDIKDSMINNLRNDTIKDLQLRFDHEVAMHQQEQKANNWQKGALVAIIVVILLVAYIVIRRMKEKSKLQEAQMLINDYTTQIRELEKSKTEAGETINELQNKIKEQLENLSPQLLRGQMLYEQIKRGELTTIHKWSRSDEKLFVDYYKVMDYRTVNKLSSVKRADKLTDHNLFYLLLKEMGKTDPEIQELFSISNNAIRVIKSKTKEIT
jgi:hypothetical protein